MAEQPASGSGRRVVLVEDDAMVRFAQELVLRDWGYDVLALGSSTDAKNANISGVEAIIADYHIGQGQTGADIAMDIARRENRSIPTLLLSGSLGRQSGQAAARFGFASLPKPVDPEDLRLWLNSVIC